MEQVILNWEILPDRISEHIERYKGKNSPILGSGVYLFIFPTSKGYQVYYIGQTEREMGGKHGRLQQHYDNYIGNPDYWLPVSVEHYRKDIFSLFSSSSSPYIKNDFTPQERRTVGQEIMCETYFAFARVDTAHTAKLKEIEAVLQFGLLKHKKLARNNWIGEKNSSLPAKDLIIYNEYLTEDIEKMIAPSLPKKIAVSGGQITFP